MEKVSIIVPCYNEEKALPLFVKELNRVINEMKNLYKVDFEVLLVNNCSEDNTLSLMKEISANDTQYKYISFSRNFGKDSSMYAGLKHATGNYVAILDADLQDPPELLIEMYEALTKEGYDSAEAIRADRKGEPKLRSLLADMFYGMMSKISMTNIDKGARDFRLMKKKMKDAILSLEESERFTKGIFSWVGFKTKKVYFENKQRVAGETKLPTSSAFKYAFRGIVSFSTAPLLLTSIMGMIFFISAIIYTLCVIINQLFITRATPGYASLMCIMLFGFGLVLLMLGIIGQYIAQSYLEIKHRPKYIIDETNVN